MNVSTKQRETILNPDGYGINTGECGDTVEIFIKSEGEAIRSAHYQTDGCMATHLCALALIELIRGRPIGEAWQIGPEHIIAAIPHLPEDHHHCAELAAGALYRALVDLRNNQQKPWARLYRPDRRVRR